MTNSPKVAILDITRDLLKSDPSLAMPPGFEADFLEKALTPKPYCQSDLFDCIAKQQPVVFSNFPAPLAKSTDSTDLTQEVLVERLANCVGTERYKIRFGNNDNIQYLTIAEIILRWRAKGTVLGISDLPVRNLELAEIFDESFLDFCNLMPLGSDILRNLEMLTAVISKGGKLTDSHSDDMAVCNHCFVGEKLWFAWDTKEGLDAGLEDVERVEVRGRANFSLKTFASLKSGVCFLVRPGETVFLPGMYTHRVYTLTDYIGVGGFYVTLPNILHTASRWIADGSLWDPAPETKQPRLVDEVLSVGRAKLTELARSSKYDITNWGSEALPTALDHWKTKFGGSAAKLNNQQLKSFVEDIEEFIRVTGKVIV